MHISTIHLSRAFQTQLVTDYSQHKMRVETGGIQWHSSFWISDVKTLTVCLNSSTCARRYSSMKFLYLFLPVSIGLSIIWGTNVFHLIQEEESRLNYNQTRTKVFLAQNYSISHFLTLILSKIHNFSQVSTKPTTNEISAFFLFSLKHYFFFWTS